MTSLNALTPRSRLISLFAGYPEHMAVVNDDIVAFDAALAATDGDCEVKHHGRGDTPLMLAIRLHRTRIVEHLIAVGANVNFHEIGLFAARFGNQRIMETLLQAGIDLGMLFGYESNVYHYAARNSDAGALRALVAAGEFDEPNAECTEPIHFAAENENEEIMSILLAAGSYVEYSPELAMRAARNRNHKVLAMLMEAGVDINVMDSNGSFLIHRAARNPNVAVVRLSIDAGVDLNVLDRNGETPLFGACTNSNMEVLDALLAAGAEWREVGTKRTICHAVARNTNEAIVRRVIARGVDVNARDSYGRTPLMIAAESSTAPVVAIFLEAGANVHAIDQRQTTACYRACWNKYTGIMRVLIAAGARCGFDVLKAAINQSNIDAVKALIDAGMNVADEINANPRVLFDSRCKRTKILEVLFRRGVDFRVVHNGRTLCHNADRECLAVLFARGADLNAKDSGGRTPIQGAGAAFVTFIAAGIDSSQRPFANDSFENCFLAAVGHPQVPVDSVPRRQFACACTRIAQKQFDLLRLRAFQVCVGLQSFRLPALVSCEILAHAFAPLESLVAFHRVWAIVTTIKHFREKRNNKLKSSSD